MADPTAAQRDAHALLRQTFERYGLGSDALATWALDQIVAGKSIEQILLELEERPEYKTAFPEIQARRDRMAAEGIQLSPISPAEILEYRTQAKALMQSFGLPTSFYSDNSDFFDLIVGDVSMAELNQRLEIPARRIANAPPEIRSVFNELFGVDGDQALYAMFTDVDRALPYLEELAQQAESGGAARRFGFGLSRAEMEVLAAYNLSYDQMVTGFQELDVNRGLFNETLYEADFTVGEEGIASAFGMQGSDRLRKRAEARTAETSGSGGGILTQQGAVSLAAADTTSRES